MCGCHSEGVKRACIGKQGVSRDVSDMRCGAGALAGAGELLEMALGSGAVAIWDSDLVSGRIFVSQGWAKILGETRGDQRKGLAEVLERIHVNDR